MAVPNSNPAPHTLPSSPVVWPAMRSVAAAATKKPEPATCHSTTDTGSGRLWRSTQAAMPGTAAMAATTPEMCTARKLEAAQQVG